MSDQERKIKKNERGGQLVEYCLLAFTIAVVCLIAVREYGKEVNCKMASAGWYVSTSGGDAYSGPNSLNVACQLSSLP
jgi:Flp pilus assembly pilin Flp